MGFIETSYGGKPNLSDVNIDSDLNLKNYGITTDGELNINDSDLIGVEDLTFSGNLTTLSGELNINDSDLIGVNKFICNDYLGALKIASSSTLQKTLVLDDITGTAISKKFRVPSNIVSGSSFKVSVKSTNTAYVTRNIIVKKYNPATQTYSNAGSSSIEGSSTNVWIDITVSSVKAGDLYCVTTDYILCSIAGSAGARIYYDSTIVMDAVWSVED